ncbi:hypothetical protein AVEN_11751-1 [Araneus ventricosus]|uniref:Uncharacterized protein n=1 Tax=Araneus ventricosus TaxID=182803 RepID=A0A4Y2EQR5_ARAVE|nr:hypothetical protein AVEN_11751-1 [Araneus ventricosus]
MDQLPSRWCGAKAWRGGTPAQVSSSSDSCSKFQGVASEWDIHITKAVVPNLRYACSWGYAGYQLGIRGLEVDSKDIDELVEELNQELTTEELTELHCVSQLKGGEVEDNSKVTIF